MGTNATSRASVVIPTYNRAEPLQATLTALTRQRAVGVPFEVIVVDDGSTDNTAAVVATFADRLDIGYHYLERLADVETNGFCLSRVRNVGAAAATGDILIFLDCGVIAGPDFVSGHLAEHAAAGRTGDGAGLAVTGYVYGTLKVRPLRNLEALLRTETPEAVVAAIGDGPRGLDMRHDEFVAADFDLSLLTAPWILFWTCNVSVRARDFHAVGGFAEAFRGWGDEDVEFGYRLFHHGCTITVSRAAWGIEWPSPIDLRGMLASVIRNLAVFYTLHPDLDVEIYTSIRARNLLRAFEDESAAFADWRAGSPETDVCAEIEALLALVPDNGRADPPRICVIGCGERVPAGMPPALLLDFDPAVLARASRGPLDRAAHAIGLRIPGEDGTFDAVIVSSRLSGVWPMWRARITAEAERVARHVIAPPVLIDR